MDFGACMRCKNWRGSINTEIAYCPIVKERTELDESCGDFELLEDWQNRINTYDKNKNDKGTLKCLNCGNEKDFYRDIHLIGKNRVSNTGKILKKVYDIDKNGELFEPIKCCKCDAIVIENGDLI